jgi:hypothetical protein
MQRSSKYAESVSRKLSTGSDTFLYYFVSSGRVKNANPKECILIIDRETGEITLETLSSQILVKKTRPERNPDPVLPDSGATSTPTNSNPPTQAAPFRTQMSVRKEKPPAVKPPGVKAPPVRPPPVKPPGTFVNFSS